MRGWTCRQGGSDESRVESVRGRRRLVRGFRASAGVAQAQAAPALANPHHTGFIGGLSFGGGSLNCRDCTDGGGPAIRFQLGWMVNPRLAILVDWGGQPATTSGASYGGFAGAAQYFTSERVWVKGGVGAGYLGLPRWEGLGIQCLDLFGAVGADLVHRRHFGLDLSARYGVGVRAGANPRSFTVMMGFNFY